MDEWKEYISPRVLLLVPVLNLIGSRLKNNPGFPDKRIPLTLGVLGILFCWLLTLTEVPDFSLRSIVEVLVTGGLQGILCAGASVYANQIVKQNGKKE